MAASIERHTMFKHRKQPPIKSLIAQDSALEGHFSFAEGLRVDGSIKGNVTCTQGTPSLLVIAETASVVGAVVADHIIINGQVLGPVLAHTLLELQPKARITGDVSYKALEMHRGAVVNGRLIPLVEDASAQDKPTLTLAANNL